jgi:hypothetical protein
MCRIASLFLLQRLKGSMSGDARDIWVPFLDPDDIKILSMEAIWNFSEGTGLS